MKNPEPNGHMLYDSIYRKCPEKANSEMEQMADGQDLGVGGTGVTALGDFENVLELDSVDGCTVL